MKDQERLFLAIGEAAPELVARSQRVRRSRWPGYCLAAACLALVLTAGYVFLPWTTIPPADAPSDPVESPNPESPPEDQNPDPDGGRFFLPEQGSEIGALRLLSYAPQSQEKAVDFLIYVNEEQFSICEDQGLYSIRSINPLPDNFPECGLDILHLEAASPDEAKKAAEEAMKDRYPEIQDEESAVMPKTPYLRASAGTDWNSEQAELWFVSDGQEGTFVLTARYFLEAEEGLGMRFRDMASSFRVVPLDRVADQWMRSLYETVDRLFPALLSNDLSEVTDLLAEDAWVDTYGENVWKSLSVISVDYAPDNDQDPASAIVSIKHRLNLDEGESYSYLTMRLIRRDSQWLLAWSGIEK